jgi:hypothetical protein
MQAGDKRHLDMSNGFNYWKEICLFVWQLRETVGNFEESYIKFFRVKRENKFRIQLSF